MTGYRRPSPIALCPQEGELIPHVPLHDPRPRNTKGWIIKGWVQLLELHRTRQHLGLDSQVVNFATQVHGVNPEDVNAALRQITSIRGDLLWYSPVRLL
jgi:hypothetical protein